MSLPEPERAQILTRLEQEEPGLASDLARLLANHDLGASYLDAPAVQPNALVCAGDVIAGRFAILRLLGVGGMGEVYLAQDRELVEPVALKFLPAHLVQQEKMLQLFRHEVQMSRRISHPNVCRIFDLGKFCRTGGDLYFLTMEYIDGPTLAERLRLGPIPVKEAKQIVLEVLQGLGAAHDSGILHRDLKPANIMLRAVPLPSGHRAVITDFGLARPLGAMPGPGVTTGFSFVGTPLYMAPEQIEGGQSSPQTDIYSAGLVAYELFAGNLLSRSTNPLSAIVKRSRTAPRPIHEAVPEVGEVWGAALLRCLDPDPRGRPATVLELSSSLRSKKVFPPVPFSVSFSRRQVMAGALTTAVATAGIVVGVRRRERVVLADHEKLMLAPFENTIGDTVFDSVGIAIKAQLAQSKRFSVVEPADFPDALKLMLKNQADPFSASEVRHLALRVHVPLVLHSTLSRVGSSYFLQFLVERVAAGSVLAQQSWSKSFLADTPRGLLGALHEACLWLRHSAGETDSAINLNNKRPEEVTTDSWEALRDFSEGEAEAKKGQRESALNWYSSAIRRDPQFVMAHMRRGDLLYSLGREADGLQEWTAAINSLSLRPCSRREELATRAMFASDTGSLEECVSYYEELSRHYPHDNRGLRFRVLPLCLLDRRAEAVTVAEQYLRADQETSSPWLQLAFASIFAGNLERAAETVGRIKELSPESEGHVIRFRLFYQQSQYDNAEQEMREAVRSARKQADMPRHSEYQRRLAHLLADRNKVDSACALLSDAAKQDEAQGLRSSQAQKMISLAYLTLDTAKPAQVRDLCVRALELDPSIERLRRAGQLLARLGRVRDSNNVLTTLRTLPKIRTTELAIGIINAELSLPRDPLMAVRLLTEVDRLTPAAWAKEHWLWHANNVSNSSVLSETAAQIIRCKGVWWLPVEMDWPGIYYQATHLAGPPTEVVALTSS